MTAGPPAPSVARGTWRRSTLRHWALRAIAVAGLLVAALLISDSVPLQAQDGREALSDALDLTHDILNAAMPEGTVLHMRPDLVQSFIDNDHLDLPTAERIVDDVLEPQMRVSLPLLEHTIARIWASQFTPDELRDLRAYLRDRTPERTQAFLGTPLGQKYEIVGPSVDVAVQNTMRMWLIKVSRAAFAAHADELRGMGVDPATGDRLAPPK
ncbi:MAG TPA: DUF2059 domain-containing protein [Acetobacteraceae bacterium]|jgi:hypothetical protein|nr:DUF2059 domain-containing protein [Acetobacteraceae bacterium]